MNDASATPAGPVLSSTERVNTLSHFHRAEIARMAGWRDRLDTRNRQYDARVAMRAQRFEHSLADTHA